MAVLDIRGTHGSGKSWIVHQLLQRGAEPITEDEEVIGYSISSLVCAVVGKYTTTCGGCDQIGSADEVRRRVRMLSLEYPAVVLEGILVAHTFERYRQLAGELEDYRFLFLDTPLDTCIARVEQRRRQRGNTKPFDPRNVIKDWYNIHERVRSKCEAAGLAVVALPHYNPLPTVLAQLGELHGHAKTPG